MEEHSHKTLEPLVEYTSLYWSLNKASKELGINKSTLSTDAAKGKIQWHLQPDGTKRLFAPELHTFYGDRIQKRTERAERVLNRQTRPENEHWDGSANTVLESKLEVVDLLKAQIDDLRHDRDEWRKQAEDATRQLTEALTVIKSLPSPSRVEEPLKRKKFLGLF